MSDGAQRSRLADLDFSFDRSVDDRRVTPNHRGLVQCTVCRQHLPWDKAFWFERLSGGLIVSRLPAHGECLNGKTPEQFMEIADRTTHDIFLPHDEKRALEEIRERS